jgi:hypothetical protein
MKLVIEARLENDAGTALADTPVMLAVIERKDHDLTDFDLSLADGRRLLAAAQSALVARQASAWLRAEASCPRCHTPLRHGTVKNRGVPRQEQPCSTRSTIKDAASPAPRFFTVPWPARALAANGADRSAGHEGPERCALAQGGLRLHALLPSAARDGLGGGKGRISGGIQADCSLRIHGLPARGEGQPLGQVVEALDLRGRDPDAGRHGVKVGPEAG